MNLFNKLKKSNLSWILELKQLFPTIKEFFSSGGGDKIVCFKSVNSTYDVFEYICNKVVDDGVESVIGKSFMIDDAKNANVILGITKGYTNNVVTAYNFLFVQSSPSASVTMRPIIAKAVNSDTWVPASINPSTDIGQKVAQNIDKIAADIESYLEKHTENVII